MKIELDLTDREIQLLRKIISDLKSEDLDALRLQRKIADAILDATLKERKVNTK